uniref:Uncharacterized protein n=1 Tax=Sphingobacterium sp. (strain 21) TaxID=743722 RepID=F4C514_SPHS2
MKKIILLTSLILMLFFSCKKDGPNVDQSIDSKRSLEEDSANKLEFTQTFARALENQEVRAILKQEALEKIDNDYDVLYALSKNSTSSSGKTLHELISAYTEDKEHFDEIVQSLPLLTIYVPELDEFSAEKWDTENQIPIVAIRDVNDRKSNKPLLAYDASGNLTELSYREKPKDPVVVVKDNERVEAATKESYSKGIVNTTNFKNSYRVTDIAFKNSRKLEDPKSSILMIGRDSSVREPRPPRDSSSVNIDNSYLISTESVRYAYEQKLESQRDYVYYGIDPSKNVTSGKLTNRYAEHIVSIQMENEAALQKITDDWTDGNLEIVINVIALSRDGSSQSIRKAVSCSAEDLKLIPIRGAERVPTYRVGEYFLPQPLEIEKWDAYKYGEKWKFVVSEFDPGTETTTVTTVSSEFSGNFNGTVGVDFGLFKFGIGGGGTSKETKSTQVTVKTTDTSDDLYEGILNFYTPIYSRLQASRPMRYPIFPNSYTVNTGLIRLRVEPLAIY